MPRLRGLRARISAAKRAPASAGASSGAFRGSYSPKLRKKTGTCAMNAMRVRVHPCYSCSVVSVLDQECSSTVHTSHLTI